MIAIQSHLGAKLNGDTDQILEFMKKNLKSNIKKLPEEQPKPTHSYNAPKTQFELKSESPLLRQITSIKKDNKIQLEIEN